MSESETFSVSQNDIFSELNEVLTRPKSATQQHTERSKQSMGSTPDPNLVKRIGYRAAQLLEETAIIGPLAPPTRLRNNRMRLEANMIYTPDIHSDGNFFASTRT